MDIAAIVENESGALSVLGVPFERADRPFIEYWQRKTPDDFEPNNPLKRHWLEFELGGIERGKAILEKLGKHVSLHGKVVLDVGAGNGGMCIAAALSGAGKVYGIETDAERIDLARAWARSRGVEVDIRQGVAERLPFADASVDVFLLWAVIEHVESHAATLDEMARVLRPGGYVAINAPNRLSPKFFVSDPHYQIMAVSALPRPVAEWWVTKVRKITPHYGVGIFPIYSLFRRQLLARGFEVLTTEHHDWLIEKLESPEKIQSALRFPAKALRAVGINRVIATIRRNTSRMFEVIARKAT